MMKQQSKPDAAPTLPADLESRISESLVPIAPPAQRRAAMRDALLARLPLERPRFVTVRSGEGDWVPLAPKVAVKMLEDDGTMQAFLLKFEPGGRFAAHDHPGEELCLVLEGDFSLGDLELHAGDYHVARSGTGHGEASSRGGCLLFLRVPAGTIQYA
jgi:hypothetical protein